MPTLSPFHAPHVTQCLTSLARTAGANPCFLPAYFARDDLVLNHKYEAEINILLGEDKVFRFFNLQKSTGACYWLLARRVLLSSVACILRCGRHSAGHICFRK